MATSGSTNLQFQGATPTTTGTITTTPGIDIPPNLQIGTSVTVAPTGTTSTGTGITPQQIQRMQRLANSAHYIAGFQEGIQDYLESQLGGTSLNINSLAFDVFFFYN